MFRRTMLFLFALVAFAIPSTSHAMSLRVETALFVCCDASDINTMKDLTYLATLANPPETIKPRLVTLINALKAGTWTSWADADRGLILGYVASTPDGVYWRDRLIVPFASVIGVAIKSVSPSVEPPPPIVVVPPSPTPSTDPTSGLTEAQIVAIVRAEIAKIPPVTSTSAAYPDLVSVGNGEIAFIGKDNGGTRQGNIRGDFKALFGINNYDGGNRSLQNWNCFNPALPMSTFGTDSRGSFSFNGAPCPTGTWSADQTYGQAFVIDGGWAQAGYDYETGAQYKPSIMLSSQRGGMDILFTVTPWRRAGIPGVRDGDPVLNKVVFRLRSDGTPNPVDAVIDGRLQTLKGCNVGGIRVVCY